MKTQTAEPNPIAAKSIADEVRWPDQGQPPDEAVCAPDVPESFEGELGVPADDQERAGRVIHRALRACPDLGAKSPERDALWLTVQSEICTTTPKMVRPFGSSRPFLITQEQATDELITAMTWLTAHEDEARTYRPLNLFVVLRGVATKSGTGSARAAQADSLRGITEVPPGSTVGWGALKEVDAA